MFDIVTKLREHKAFWRFTPGSRYLAELEGGQVTDTYIDCTPVTHDPHLLEDAVVALLYNVKTWIWARTHPELSDREKEEGPAFQNADVQLYGRWDNHRICGAAFGGITLAYEVARQMRANVMFTEPTYGIKNVVFSNPDGLKTQFQATLEKTGQYLKRFRLDSRGHTLLTFVDDVILDWRATADMIEAVYAQVNRFHATSLGCVLCLVNCSGSNDLIVNQTTVPFTICSLWNMGSTCKRTWASFADFKKQTAGQEEFKNVEGTRCPIRDWHALHGIQCPVSG